MSDQTDPAILVATSSILGEYDGQPVYIHRGVTTVRAGHPLLDALGEHFVPLVPTFELVDEADEVPAGVEGGPTPKDVRTWAAEQKIEVPARGRIPAEVVEQYQAAHSEA